MVGRVAWLDDAPGATRPDPREGDEHPMRKVTKQVAFDGGWDEERRRKVAELFDSMAADWTANHDSVERRPVAGFSVRARRVKVRRGVRRVAEAQGAQPRLRCAVAVVGVEDRGGGAVAAELA